MMTMCFAFRVSGFVPIAIGNGIVLKELKIK